MYHPLLDTFLAVADCGSFLKASEKLYISPTAIMKQMNQLERQIGLPLLVRTSQGVCLTAAGRSIYKDAGEIMEQSREAVRRAYRAENRDQITIRLGTSALYPCWVLMGMWLGIRDRCPQFRLKVVPFEDSGAGTAFAHVGEKYDLMVGPWDSVRTARYNRFVELGRYRFCIAVPGNHDFSQRESLSYEDLHGQRLLIQKEGNSPVNDRIRREIQEKHPQITLVDVPYHYDLEVFNRCEEEGCLLLSLECWKEIHPSLHAVFLEVDYGIPYGIIYSAGAGQDVRYFLHCLSLHAPQALG